MNLILYFRLNVQEIYHLAEYMEQLTKNTVKKLKIEKEPKSSESIPIRIDLTQFKQNQEDLKGGKPKQEVKQGIVKAKDQKKGKIRSKDSHQKVEEKKAEVKVKDTKPKNAVTTPKETLTKSKESKHKRVNPQPSEPIKVMEE